MQSPTARVLLFAACSAVCSVTVSAAPEVIRQGYDAWRTPRGRTWYSFTSPAPIPAGFFGAGSDPYTGLVKFEGAPIPVSAGTLGGADTLVHRLADSAAIDAPLGMDTVPIEIAALNLVSIEPITVTFNGGASSAEFDVRVCLSDAAAQPPGTMTFHQTVANGGSFDTTLPVKVQFIFTGPGGPFTLDCGSVAGNPLCGDLSLSAVNMGWIRTGAGHLDPTALAISHIANGVQFQRNCAGALATTVVPVTPNSYAGMKPSGNSAVCTYNEEAESRLVASNGNGEHTVFMNDPNDLNHNGIPDRCEPAVPTVSEWGAGALALLVLVAGTVVLRRSSGMAM